MRVHLAIRKRLMDAATACPKEGVGVALSGGVDSCSVLAALLRAGHRPTVLSYTPNTHESTDHQYARNNAIMHGLPFVSVPVEMSAAELDILAHKVVHLGFRTKMQVESLSPMIRLAYVARAMGLRYLFTGDQADGYYINGNWISRNYDRARGIPGPLRQHVKEDSSAARIDDLRQIYYQEDRANCGAIGIICGAQGVEAIMPYRHEKLLRSFQGTHWRHINEPRLKETTWQAFPEMHTGGRSDGIWVRDKPVNLHRGDSRFAEMMGKLLLEKYPQYKTPLGIYGGMARGEI